MCISKTNFCGYRCMQIFFIKRWSIRIYILVLFILIQHKLFWKRKWSWFHFRFKDSGNCIIFIPIYFIELCLKNTKLIKKHFVFKDLQKREIHKPLSIRQSWKNTQKLGLEELFSRSTWIPQIATENPFPAVSSLTGRRIIFLHIFEQCLNYFPIFIFHTK